MQPVTRLVQLLSFLFGWIGRPKTITIKVKEGEQWVNKQVPNGSSFDYFNEQFGEGNWSLIASSRS